MDAADVLTGILLVAGATLPIVFGVAWYHSRRRIRELEARLRETDLPADARVEALERSVDALTEQLEQLASGQEFLTRLLATQHGRLPSEPPSPQVITPH
jgi:hypothetical protein